MSCSGTRALCIVLSVVSLSCICESKNWRRVNTTCPRLEQCDCRILQAGATVLCQRVKSDVDLSGELAKLQGTMIRRLTFSNVQVDTLPSSWFRNITVVVLMINYSPVRLIEDQAFFGVKRLKIIEFVKTRFATVPRALSALQQLRDLRIQENFVTTIGNELQSLRTLVTLSFSENQINFIKESAFATLKNLRKLRLQNNRLEYLPPLLFKDLTKLEVVDLHDNRIKTVHDAFQGLPFLKEIYLYGNAITDIDKLAKGDLKSLKILTADNNFMNSILDFGPINIKIEILRLRNCGISYIHPFAFRALEKLTYLDVANNKISHINGSAFHRASGLLYFSGGTNNIISLAGTFSRTRKLLSLNVSYNVIDDVTDAFTQLVVLRKLMLRNNRIKYIRDGTFRNNGNLKYLDLAENRIEWLGKRAFSGLVNLDLLSVSDNFLLHLNGSVSHMPQLRILNFSHNAIQTLYGNDFYNDPELTFIYAYGNNLSTIEGAFQTSPKLRSLHIQKNNLKTLPRTSFPASLQRLQILVFEGNPITCDCRMSWLLRMAQHRVQQGSPVCEGPPPLRGRLFHNMTKEDLTRWPTDCFESCACYCYEDDSPEQNIYVNCSNAHLMRIPKYFPKGTRIGDFSGNQLERLDDTLVKKAPSIESLILRNNTLSIVEPAVVPDSVRHLNLRNNKLTRLPLDLVEKLNLTSILLAGNPWHCKCEDYAFRQWAEANSYMVQDADEIMCSLQSHTPEAMKPFMKLGQKELCPSATSALLLYGAHVLVFLACALTASTAYLKYKREIKVWLYARGLCSRLQCIKEDDLDDDKLFDVFLSFSSKDSNWAYNELIPKIESHGFSICTYDRNFKGGYLVQDIIHEAVACSRRILLLLTENFVESEWCRWEFRVAHHRALEDNTNRLIVVLVDEVTSDAVDEELRRYMQVTNFLRWGESHFWDKLLYSLPKKDSQRRLIPSSQEYASSHL
ncbi:protein toll isoform X1 [Ixodes scapularis]|uniref:protein toll isoform X1 n=1 Tax=Ixodes scapularis TaxID=6945 RepID=UPI001A9F4D28|nr:protein toll isoform X1 [Ixodes scapularis]XP_040065072.1 protein toll isoform X1 [Ixodes scapularis]